MAGEPTSRDVIAALFEEWGWAEFAERDDCLSGADAVLAALANHGWAEANLTEANKDLAEMTRDRTYWRQRAINAEQAYQDVVTHEVEWSNAAADEARKAERLREMLVRSQQHDEFVTVRWRQAEAAAKARLDHNEARDDDS